MYNVAPYVERCIRSLEEQDIPSDDFELLCINDGSPDNCSSIVSMLQREYSNIYLIEQSNCGVSSARNRGIEKASGKYLMFIDPDDYVDKNCLRRILDRAEKLSAQVYFLGFTFLKEDNTIKDKLLYEKFSGQVYPGVRSYFISRLDGRTDPDRMVGVLFDSNFLKSNDLLYLQDVPYLEDGEFIARILCLAERCIFDNSSFYQRTTRLGSATNSDLFHSEKATNGFLLAVSNLKAFQNERKLSSEQINFLNQAICKFVILTVESVRRPLKISKIRDVRRRLDLHGLSKVNLDSVNRQFKKLGSVYNWSIYLLVFFQFYLHALNFFKLKVRSCSVKKAGKEKIVRIH